MVNLGRDHELDYRPELETTRGVAARSLRVGLVCTSLDQLLVNVLLGRVFTILRQFDYAFLLRRTVGCLFFKRQWCIVAMIVGVTPMYIGKIL
jgi:hypothetical protein